MTPTEDLTPKAIPGSTEIVSVEWLLQNLTGATDIPEFSPRKLVLRKCDWSLAQLIDSVLADGFTIPIAVRCLPTGFLLSNGRPAYTLGNGHHRFVLAILLCADTIPVYWAQEWPTSSTSHYYTSGEWKGKSSGVADRVSPIYGHEAVEWMPLVIDIQASVCE